MRIRRYTTASSFSCAIVAAFLPVVFALPAWAKENKPPRSSPILDACPQSMSKPREIPDLPAIPVASQFLGGTEYPRAVTGPASRQTYMVKAKPHELIQWYASSMRNYGWTVDIETRSFVSATSRSGNSVSIQADGASTNGCRLAIYFSSLNDN